MRIWNEVMESMEDKSFKESEEIFLQAAMDDETVENVLQEGMKALQELQNNGGRRTPFVLPKGVLPEDVFSRRELRKFGEVVDVMSNDPKVAKAILKKAMSDPRIKEVLEQGGANAKAALSEFSVKKDELVAFLEKYGKAPEVSDTIQGWLKVVIELGSRYVVKDFGPMY